MHFCRIYMICFFIWFWFCFFFGFLRCPRFASAQSFPPAQVVASSNSSASSTLRREPPFGKVETKADPFRDYRYEDPFATVDEVDVPRGASAPPLTDTKSAAFDPFFNVGGGDPFLAPSSRPQNGLPSSTLPLSKSKASKKTAPSEDQQRAWATTESVLSEKERRKRADQEKADYKLALKLSKAEGGGKKKSFRSKILLWVLLLFAGVRYCPRGRCDVLAYVLLFSFYFFVSRELFYPFFFFFGMWTSSCTHNAGFSYFLSVMGFRL